MSLFKISNSNVETFTVVTNPIRHYTSSSTSGVTGSVHIFPRRSHIEKETTPQSSFIDASHDDADLEGTLRQVQQSGRFARDAQVGPSGSFFGMLDAYMDKVSAQSTSARKQKALDIVRYTPSVNFSSDTLAKMMTRDVLMHRYRTAYPSAHWGYVNYNSLNFFTASTVPTSSVLLYPNIDSGPAHVGYVSGTYSLSGAFSFDFSINPRYRPEQYDGAFKAGTILHLSSTYALSLVTGSAKDENGLPLGYRLLLQLSHSADIRPSEAIQDAYPSDLVFLSDDNSLSWNRWSRVIVRWGTNLTNEGTGSFNIDGVDRGTFIVPSGTISPRLFPSATFANPDVLCVGNYYEGNNRGVNAQAYFFANDPSLRDGLVQLIDDVGGINEPTHYAFNHPLCAEVHDLAIRRRYLSNAAIAKSASYGPKSLETDEYALYVPPFFVEQSPFRQFVGDVGGILQTPFFEVDGTTNDPFNVAVSFGVAGQYINIENYVRDFASNVFPRVHHMTGVAIENTTEARSANDFFYDQPFVVRRNLLIMPCDDGLFVPSFELLVSESMQTTAVDALGNTDNSLVSLDNMVSTASFLFGGAAFDDGTVGADKIHAYANELIGHTPEQPGLPPGKASLAYVDRIAKAVQSGTFDVGLQEGAPLTVLQRTRDFSSDQVTFFDISNLFYGKRIHPKSLIVRDPALSGSSGVMRVTLKDDGRGGLYRADSFTSASVWNSVGTVFYDEGIIVIKNPHLYFFGKEGFEFDFRGEQGVHVMKVSVTAPANMLNSSSNPSYVALPPSASPNDPDKGFVYITGINFHDKDLNVVMKTQLAQPILKRYGDRVKFVTKIDF